MLPSTTQGSPGPAAFRKRFYTLPQLVADMRVLAGRRADLRAIFEQQRMDPLLREQVTLAVSEVNGCGFCTYIHQETALAAGADIRELAAFAGLDPETVDEDHVIAIMWAQSRAEAGMGEAGEHLERAVTQRFTAQQRRDLDTVIRWMTLSNLAGNTLEALIRRVRGRKVPGSRLFDELVIGGVYVAGSIQTGLRTARMRGKSVRDVLREATATIRASA
ncbi:carboxymuconolactone decarboxylase family protein [Nocardia pseudobrasiliensis]|uniref:AhpD family alkylhydroperoxidase n=1 Tax=Nocardia pseudobrasiliensis TaxID=45979 RepID=A0A370HXZ3_9NOCA|nr:carboxymuconolactone decarboxylase family protein [Nocardia pseudobrasiliensis]RDI63329.1 AhpD family alkylhydroperoxidase [Nocardia pseudobrasiliensis]